MISYMQETGQVWFATLEQIANHVKSCATAGTYRPRVDRLPYYNGPQKPEREISAAARDRGAWKVART